MVEEIFYKKTLENLFLDPVQITLWDGNTVQYGEGNPQFHITFHKPLAKKEIIKDPSIAFGEAYMNGDIEIEGNLEKAIESIYKNKDSFLGNSKLQYLTSRWNFSKRKNKEDIAHHYDIGNDFYKLWLDETMTYSCAYFQNETDSLTVAQHNKVNHILKKLNLQKGDTLLDIGCGWGELITAAAKQYGVKATGVTLSEEQYAKTLERIEKENLTDLVEVNLLDYRDIHERKFDKIVSVGMIEHVGKDHITEYFETVNALLNDGGISVLHCITSPTDGATNSWIEKYIFPGGYVPAINELITNITNQHFFIVDVESLRRHYGKTLQYWAENFENTLDEIRKTKDERFIRMWRLYLNACAASFYTGNIDLHQFVFTKGISDSIPWTRSYMYK
ncbi:class I SAM-dependent methyltransferase [Bacillus cereus]|uniref:Probable cyclopropane-fatty-acyl-phospholipid synthase n=1 Tax=Bacillus cereus (strain ZK / E33L) TaxID=288681 RepID=Q63GQ7_BACCZ|nr:cyclopropane-fatty-acyl-phospholipid synthase family protein [Bacillus cereus]AAU19944.1 probable cyclopropane-fatty-acyl-phospholipid synthase [Bacillus cereus E33L]AJI28788.1 methyltransferase small domain protein [Bacillus cereus E33L]MCU4785371.1 cyclopropane-fatty-acyl-phospholipid synthase family protein [Bacillus cereus]MCU5553470.1 cyclopropane-fatty-acyl-phospholipid synthase family protein [Bacillus cereus]QQA20653.1 class I SAM-dependent methyltransferase [Bacillus cereus]